MTDKQMAEKRKEFFEKFQGMEITRVRLNILTNTDIGRWVFYIPNHAKEDKSQWERGKIKSFNNESRAAWVVYKANDNWDGDHWKDYTAAMTNYDNLQFI